VRTLLPTVPWDDGQTDINLRDLTLQTFRCQFLDDIGALVYQKDSSSPTNYAWVDFLPDSKNSKSGFYFVLFVVLNGPPVILVIFFVMFPAMWRLSYSWR
jgi:hypothetical protein